MENSAIINISDLDKINSCHTLIKMIENQERELRTSIAKRKLNYKGRHANLVGYMQFFRENDLTKEASALEFDLEINEKALGKRELKRLGGAE